MTKRPASLIVSLLLPGLLVLAGCLPRSITTPDPAVSTATSTASGAVVGPSAQISAAQGGTLTLPSGAQLEVPAGALSQDALVSLTDAGPAEPAPAGSPFAIIGNVVSVDFGGAELNGPVTLAFPLAGATSQIALSFAPGPIYAILTRAESGNLALIGAQVQDGRGVAHVYRPGDYVLVSVADQDVFDFPAPLQVPSYPRGYPAWGETTALTDLAQYHQGAWPAGGQGGLFGESSNYYLAGRAGQPTNEFYFSYWLMKTAGLMPPVQPGLSFSNADMELLVWEFESPDPGDRAALFAAFKAYVQGKLWGANGLDPRPVGWTSSLAGASRIITGSDSLSFTYNETADGTANVSQSWADYKQLVMEPVNDEVIFSLIFNFPMRPEIERRGVIWLTSGETGSVRYVNGPETLSWWIWDGSGGHFLGYYYDDPGGGLPDVQGLENAFPALGPNDRVDYRFSVYNIAAQSYAYHMHVDLIPDGAAAQPIFDQDTPVLAPHEQWDSDGSFLALQSLGLGSFTLKYTLSQGGVVNDVKYVEFAIKPFEEVNVPFLYPKFKIDTDAGCRQGPGTFYALLAGVPAGEEIDILGISQDGNWFLTQWNKFPLNCWVAASTGHSDDDLSGLTAMLASTPTPTITPVPTATPTPRIPSPTPTATPRR